MQEAANQAKEAELQARKAEEMAAVSIKERNKAMHLEVQLKNCQKGK